MEPIRDIRQEMGLVRSPHALSQHANRQERQSQTVDLLTALGMARRQVLEGVELMMYSKALEEFPDGAITLVLTRLPKSKREEYEPRIPELGDLIDMVRTEARRMDRPHDCEVCDNSRLVVVEEGGERVAKRCQCFIEWKERREGVGGSNL